jgi:hypothetical protein
VAGHTSHDPLLPDEETTPLERVLTIADSGSGASDQEGPVGVTAQSLLITPRPVRPA